MKKYIILSLILGVDVAVLLYEVSQLSIGYSEIELLHAHFSMIKFLVNLSLHIFGKNDFALRFPMILLHVFSVLLLFNLLAQYLKKDSDRLWIIAIFILLPGVMSSAIVVNSAGFVIFGLLLYLNLYKKNIYFKYLLLPLLLFCDQSFMLLFISLSFYGLNKRDKNFALYNLLLFCISLYLYGFDTTGLPKGHFLDTLAIYSAIFTPLIFIYIFYTLYRRYITSQRDILWYLASISFILSLLISFRQRLHVEIFAPYLIVSLPIVAQTFLSSYRVRLPQFRIRYKIIFFTSLIFLLINAPIIVFNKYLYLFLRNPRENFAYNMQITKDLANKLKNLNISCIDAHNHQMQVRLTFYNINYCSNISLTKKRYKNSKSVTISYITKPVYIRYVTKLNKSS